MRKSRISKWLMTAGVILVVGSIGACENGDYTIMQCAFCILCGISIGLAGADIGKEG